MRDHATQFIFLVFRSIRTENEIRINDRSGTDVCNKKGDTIAYCSRVSVTESSAMDVQILIGHMYVKNCFTTNI